MAIHHWTKVRAELFHHFHQRWMGSICDALNSGRLPVGYYALVEQTTYGVAPDVVTLQGWRRSHLPGEPHGVIAMAEAPPRTRFVTESTDEEAYAARASRVAVRNPEDEVVAVVEFVSPGNKSARHAIKSCVDKTIDLLRQGINLLIIDLLAPTPRDPEGIHQAVWSELTDEDFKLPVDKRLTLVSYAAGVPLRAFVEPVAVGDTMPEMALFLDPANYVLVPLEDSYQVTWHGCPEEFRERITGPSTPGSDPAEASP